MVFTLKKPPAADISMLISTDYPLANVYLTMENHHFIAGEIHYFYDHVQVRKLLVYQRVVTIISLKRDMCPGVKLSRGISVSPTPSCSAKPQAKFNDPRRGMRAICSRRCS